MRTKGDKGKICGFVVILVLAAIVSESLSPARLSVDSGALFHSSGTSRDV